MSFCLPQFAVEKFIDALKRGVIDPAKLADMTSAERRSFFEKIVGEDAQQVNALFESKLLLKNQQAGMITWAKKISGISETTRKDIISRIEKNTELLDAGSEATFLKDVTSMRIGTDVSFEEAGVISKLSKETTESLAKIKEDSPIGSADRLRYGAARTSLMNYVNDLKLSAEKQTLKESAISAVKDPIEAFSQAAGVAKGIKASMDVSALFRQGWKTLFSDNKIWRQNAVKTIGDIKKQLGTKASDDAVMDAIKADVYSRPNALNKNYERMKLDIGTGEEAYPSLLPEKVPVLGRVYKTSEIAYNGFLMRMRADLADKYIAVMDDLGVDIKNKTEAESVGKMVNSLTGRGSIGSFEKVGKQVNTIFFSPKNLKSNIDFLTAHALQKNVTPFVRKQAAINLLKAATGTALILAIADALMPGSVEKDSKSADFGKIRIGDTRFDVTGGMGSLVVLATRLITGESKSSTSGKISELNSGKFGATTKGDVVFNFMENKYSPAFSVLKQMRDDKDFSGESPTAVGLLKDLLVPLPVTTTEEVLKNPKAAPLMLTLIAEMLGISTNTYSR